MSARSGLRRPGRRSFLAAGATLLVALAWWTGILGPAVAPIPGGFGTLFALVAFFCVGQGVLEIRADRKGRGPDG